MKNIVSGIMLILLVINISALAFSIQPITATWTGVVYIRADGSIDPPTAPISNAENFYYTLMDNIYGFVIVERNNIVLDGAGHIIQGENTGTGIYMKNVIGVTVKNVVVKNFEWGIEVRESSNNYIIGNTIQDIQHYGIFIVFSSNNYVADNSISRCNTGICLMKGETLKCSDNRVIGNYLVNTISGIRVLGNNNIINENIVTDCGCGIILSGALHNTITKNKILKAQWGGIQLSPASNNNISRNIISGKPGWYGIWLRSSSENIIRENNVSNFSLGGIYLEKLPVPPDLTSEPSMYNKIYHNNFIQNTPNARCSDSINVWDDGYPSGGNYWSDYKGIDANGDGIGDTPYIIDKDNRDRYPLMKPWTLIPLERIYGIPVDFRFQSDLSKGANHPEVRYLQIILNTDPDTYVATSGPGSPGNETTYFGPLTEDAVKRFQKKYGLPETGYVGYATREKLNGILAEKFTITYKEKFGLLDKEERKSTIWRYIKEFKSNYLPEDFPNELVLAVAAQETGEYAHWNNEHVADDWGRGIMQITTDSYVGAGGVDSTSEECIKAKNSESKIYSSMYYSNTLEGIEANIKDGLYALGDKYQQVKKDKIHPPEGYTKDEIIWMSTVQRYNGFRAKPSEYIWHIGDKLIRLANGEYGDFEGFNKEYARLLGKKFQKAYVEKITLYSPAQLRVYDSEGNVAGLVNGQVREGIPNSIYDNEARTVLIFYPSEDYFYNIIGVDEGTYGLNIESFKEGESVSFTATDIPISINATHQYTVDWGALSLGEKGVTVKVDSDGDGVFEHTFTSDSELTQREYVIATDDIPPQTWLNIREPKFVVNNVTYLTSATPIALIAEDNPSGSVVALTAYRIYNASYDSGWITYTQPFYLTGLSDGTYQIDYNSTDYARNVEPIKTATIILDNTPPKTTLTIGEPKYLSDIIYVTPDTPFILEANDVGSGVYSTVYRIYNSTYDSEWIPYRAPFNLTALTGGVYTIEFYSTDNLDNIEATSPIQVTLFFWDYIFKDSYGRETVLKINFAHQFFQFIMPNKNDEIRQATHIQKCGKTIIILHYDDEIRVVAVAIPKLDFCAAITWDKQTHTRYILLDRTGYES